MMSACSLPKVPTLVWSFLVKVGILALGVGWVFLLGVPSPPNPIVPEKAPVLPTQTPGRPVEASVPQELKPLSAQSIPIRPPAMEHFSPTGNPERVEAKTGFSPLVDVNEATQEELERLPGLGTVLAQRILAYRQANGPFHQVEELERVRGIGHKRLEQLRPMIRMTSKKA